MLHARDGHNYGLNQRYRPLSLSRLGLLLVTQTERHWSCMARSCDRPCDRRTRMSVRPVRLLRMSLN